MMIFQMTITNIGIRYLHVLLHMRRKNISIHESDNHSKMSLNENFRFFAKMKTCSKSEEFRNISTLQLNDT